MARKMSKKEKGRKIVKAFEMMRDRAELKALSRASQLRPLTDEEFRRMRQLARELFMRRRRGKLDKVM